MFDQDRLMLLMSAIQKAIRCCEVNDARYFASELIDMGTPHSAIGQLRIIAAEDIGLADPTMVQYIDDFFNSYRKKQNEKSISHEDVRNHPELRELIDRAVIAEAVSWKSRDLPMANWVTLWDIYKKEKFSESNNEYFNRFIQALEKDDEKEALYYGILVNAILGEKRLIRNAIIKHSEKRNEELVNQWMKVYEGHKNLLELTGSIALICRDLVPHGEYQDEIDQYLDVPIEKAEIPDRAYDMHTQAGRDMDRTGIKGLDHFLTEGIRIEKERFPNRYHAAGKKANQLALRQRLWNGKTVIDAIKKKRKPPSGVLTF